MKKFKLFSFASFIKGRKSNGTEDVGSIYKHWKALSGNNAWN